MGEWWREFRGRGVKAALQAATRYAANEAAINELLEGGGASLSHQATVLIPHADIITLRTNYVTVAGAPDADWLLVPVTYAAISTLPDGAYTNITAYNLGAGVGILLLAWGDWIAEAGGYIRTERVLAGARAAIGVRKPLEEFDIANYPLTDVQTKTECIGLPLKFIAGNTGDFTGGGANNTLRISAEFRVLNTATGLYLSTEESGWDQATRTFV